MTVTELNYDLINADIFLPFMAVESETDFYPLEDERNHYSKKYIAELDQKLNDYINRNSEDVMKLCHQLIQILQAE